MLANIVGPLLSLTLKLMMTYTEFYEENLTDVTAAQKEGKWRNSV
jgi:hypothetical protein